MERICINCKHYREHQHFMDLPSQCVALSGKIQHPVTGGDFGGVDPGLMRLTLCGWKDPKWFEAKTDK